MNSTENVLEQIETARLSGDFDSVKRLSKKALEDPQSDIPDLLIMDQIAHMYLDSFLVWINEMKKTIGDGNGQDVLSATTEEYRERLSRIITDGHVNKYNVLCDIAIGLAKNYNQLVFHTPCIAKMMVADAEEVREKFLSVDGLEDDNETQENDPRVLAPEGKGVVEN